MLIKNSKSELLLSATNTCLTNLIYSKLLFWAKRIRSIRFTERILMCFFAARKSNTAELSQTTDMVSAKRNKNTKTTTNKQNKKNQANMETTSSTLCICESTPKGIILKSRLICERFNTNISVTTQVPLTRSGVKGHTHPPFTARYVTILFCSFFNIHLFF